MLSESVIIRKVNYRRNNVKKNNRKYFSDISMLTLLVLVMSALYILYFVAEMKNSSELFLTAYTSVPYMMEHILAGVTVFLAFAVIDAKINDKCMTKTDGVIMNEVNGAAKNKKQNNITSRVRS